MKLSLFILVSLLSFSLLSQYDVKKDVKVNLFNDGAIKSSVTTVEKKTKGIKLHEFYLEKSMTRIDFYHNQSKKLEIVRKTKKGTYGKPCNEILFHQIDYYTNGKKKYEYEGKCDCHKEKRTYYNEDGQVTKVEKSSVKWIRPKKEN